MDTYVDYNLDRPGIRRKFMTVLFLSIGICSIILGISIAISLNGGAGTIPETNSQAYLKARTVFNGILSDYVDQKRMADADTKARWTKDIDPWFIKADSALDAWGRALDQGESAEAQQSAFSVLKTKLLSVMLTL